MRDPRSALAELSGARMDRRRFLAWTGALASTALYSQARGDLAVAAPPLPRYPFTLGVASGEPHAGGVTLWTRLAPEPFAKNGGISAKSVQVQWQVATDEGFTNLVASGTVAALTELGALRARRRGRSAARQRSTTTASSRAGTASPTGRTKTAPSGHVAELALRVRLVPGTGRTASTRRTGTWPSRTSTSSSTWATTSTKAASAHGGIATSGPRHAARGVRLARATTGSGTRSTRPTRTCRRSTPLPLGRHLGRPRGRQQLRRHPPCRTQDDNRGVPPAPCRRLPGLLRAHAAAR